MADSSQIIFPYLVVVSSNMNSRLTKKIIYILDYNITASILWMTPLVARILGTSTLTAEVGPLI